MHSVDTSACVQIHEFSTQDRTRGRLSTPRRSHVDRQVRTARTYCTSFNRGIATSTPAARPESGPPSLFSSLLPSSLSLDTTVSNRIALYLAKAPRGTDCSTQTFASETIIAIRSPFSTHPSEPVSSPCPLSWTIRGLFRCTHTYTPFTGPSPPSKLGTLPIGIAITTVRAVPRNTPITVHALRPPLVSVTLSFRHITLPLSATQYVPTRHSSAGLVLDLA
ncbi:hypothetical protein LZ31DRAFT_5493 [Colletotrichum somersetense]|nr:hypothetical protein LZ31DRAFT_5493 [Colletotrichum somersetense]